ncbi:Lar family restriction alleviation protein [Pseudomonas sp. BYT-5]|uniref:Lar family restriction alleviation protein n=1 Tax=unclassified Pseudomonas TaxID=196821 RepID=UPI00202093AA|nr:MULTISPECIES: Lar family restriction alleviation protein [unclassified Pseudomonas]URD44511.1 Lar family restriction alleviation protein [Pseudomonas sp. BYT-5]URK99837.1 Lar family restriction alleviation protein [Pseudomonas sp. BYT-1]
MVSDLLPCPFCGEKPQITKHHREDIYSFMHRCQVLGPISWGFREDQQAHIEKWNARAKPAGQHQGDAIGTLVRDYNERIVFTPIGDPHIIDDMKVYAHADPREVERLRAEIEEWNRIFDMQEGKIDAIRAQLVERDALLREAHEELVCRDSPVAQRIIAALSASAEPSAPKCETCSDQGIVGNILNAETCMDCTPSAPVERDERAAFEKGYHKDALHRDGDEYSRMAVQMAWEGWQARAALERKPS